MGGVFFDEYLIEPLKYAYSNLKRIFTGGVLYLLASFGVVFGIWDIVSSVIILIPEINKNLSLSFVVFSEGFVFGILAVNSSTSIILGIIFIILGISIFCILSGYTYSVINHTINGKNTLPRWKNCKHLFYKGTILLIGMLILSILFDIPNIALRTTLNALYPQYFFNNNMLQLPPQFVAFSASLTILGMIVGLLNWIYTPLAAVNFVKKDDFFGFFQVKEIVYKMSFEYFGIVFIIITISTILWILCFSILALITASITLAFDYITGLAMAVVLGCFTVPFLAFFLRVFRYRAYAKYYKNKEDIAKV